MKSKNRIFLVFLAMALLLGAMGTAQASPTASPVGFVDYLYLINHHPDTPKANEALKAEQDQDKQQFTEKSANLSDQDKQALDRQLGQQIEQKRLELLKPITENINAAIKEVADAKGLSVVVGKNTVIYGGTDITQDVLQKIGGK
ncbi:MAG: OmpH family outer membrane protein [Veillonellales bacterium]